MELDGKLIEHLPVTTGEGKNGAWQKSGFVIETNDAKYPKKVCLSTWGETVDEAKNVAIGTNVKALFDVESREYQGKWYTDAKCFKISWNKNGNYETPTPQPKKDEKKNVESFVNNNTDDLPF